MSETTTRMDWSTKLLPLLPMGFAASFLLSFISINLGRFRAVWLLRPVAIVLGGGGLISLLIFRLIRNRQLAAVVSTLVVIFTLYAGNLSRSIGMLRVSFNPWETAAHPLANTVIESIILALPPIIVALAIYLLSLRPRFLKPVITVLTIILVSSSITFLFPIVKYSLKGSKQGDISHLLSPEALAALSAEEPARDIYYVVIDSYADNGILGAQFDFDNSQFLEFLRDRGFFVGRGSQSNYVLTRHSLSSTLNLDYIQSIVGDVEYAEGALADLIRHSRVRQVLEEMGYQTIAFETGFATTEVYDAAVYYRATKAWWNPVETTLIPQTAWRYVLSVAGIRGEALYLASYEPHINRVLNVFDNLGEVADVEGPKFVIVHILIPHPPFVFGPDGQITIPPYPFAFHDGFAFPGDRDQYIQGYIGQLRYVNAGLRTIIANLLEVSSESPIIILQGDHGPRVEFDWSSPTPENLEGGFSILNAMLLPGIDPAELHEDLSPVNTFRIVLNEYFGADYPYLPDLHFFPGANQDDLAELRQVDP